MLGRISNAIREGKGRGPGNSPRKKNQFWKGSVYTRKMARAHSWGGGKRSSSREKKIHGEKTNPGIVTGKTVQQEDKTSQKRAFAAGKMIMAWPGHKGNRYRGKNFAGFGKKGWVRGDCEIAPAIYALLEREISAEREGAETAKRRQRCLGKRAPAL